MARINGTEQPIKKAETSKSDGGFGNNGKQNYISDNFADIHCLHSWPMVEDVQSCIDSLDKLITKKRLKIK